MKKRWRLLLWLLFLGLGCALVFIPHFKPAPEPLYEGRPLSQWLDHHVASTEANPPYGSPGWNKADEALRAIGTNGLPVLLKMLRAKDQPRLFRFAAGFADRHFRLNLSARPAQRIHEEAEYAFGVLGSSASNAVPELIEIYEQNISRSSQDCTAKALGSVGTPAQSAVPSLIKRFQHPDQEVRFGAVSAVMKIRGDPNLIFPALTAALKDPFVSIRWNALVGLSQYFGRARPIVGEILQMLNDPGMVGAQSITQQVATAVWRIAPEKIGHPLVVASSSSVASNGVTIAPLKFLLFGAPKILIPPGRPTPALAQYWNSDPRPKLTLSCGDANEQFLGHFEVLGVGSSPDVNISTLAIITDTEIILTARDNSTGQFLEIRPIQ